MTLLLSDAELRQRGAVARGSLAPLADGLRRELVPLLTAPPELPVAKALLTRKGGRCDRDGTLLTYDPFDARHRCAQCGRELGGEEHDGFRLYWHQLWLAERVLHAAVLGSLLDDPPCRDFAREMLVRYGGQYLRYPNEDNVLGPSRPFFSTYLESIWLLQLTIAVDLLEAEHSFRPVGARLRDELIAPSAALIASYDEGMSNRQVWNNAALIAAGTVLGDAAMIARALEGPSGLHVHLEHALLSDGSWYEGENYHLFAHRGLWYGVQMAETMGRPPSARSRTRFDEGFAAPFRTILPDLTYPSRRDSQYAVSVRQPRFAESCELGLARVDDERLRGMLARLYEPGVPRRETGRSATSADVERNLPPTGLTRADLSWRALLVARAELPPLRKMPLTSDLLPAQGIGIQRRAAGALYAALDYGHSGGGHGHPDRLNLLLARGETRWFDDPGTGSYVDPTLQWYRSTLAHTAPVVDGRSQPRVHGRLLGYDVQGEAGWVSAEATLADDLRVRRSVVVLDDYLLDVLEWVGDTPHEIALPLHGMELVTEHGRTLGGVPTMVAGGTGAEDGFTFLEQTELVDTDGMSTVLARSIARGLRGWVRAEASATWWRALAPAAPGRPGPVPMLLVRCTGATGRIVSAWTWSASVSRADLDSDVLRVARSNGTFDVHRRVDDGWSIALRGERALTTLRRTIPSDDGAAESTMRTLPERGAVERPPSPSLPARFALGEAHYRRSEQSWAEAGRPGATVRVSRPALDRLVIDVDVAPSSRLFVSVDADNPLDNEPAAINGDGVQLYVALGESRSGWLLSPIGGCAAVGLRRIEGWAAPMGLEASWRETPLGWRLHAEVALPEGPPAVELDVIVNEIAPGRARRRGQLVLSGAQGAFVYLRGDRHDRERLLRFAGTDD